MKKLLMLLLCLLLLLTGCTPETPDAQPTAAPTDDLGLETRAIDFGDFVMTAFNVDAVDMRSKSDGEVWAILYPLYMESAPFHDTITVVWYQDDLTETVDAMGVEVYAEMLLRQNMAQYNAQGIAATNARLASARYEEGQMAMAYSMDMDYSGAGTDLQVTMWQMQHYVLGGEDGTYVFTLTADSLEDLQLLTYYLTATAFPEK